MSLGVAIDTFAVDWSGAARGARQTIWIAEVHRGGFIRLECGRDRSEVVEHLLDASRTLSRLVVGLNFAFSMPEWFAREHGIDRVDDLWDLAAREGERWLAECAPPFWGRPGRRRPPHDPDRPPYRRTEGERLPLRGVGPKSVFQIAGAGAVGTGSLRGMPCLRELRAAGFAVWPFDRPRFPLLVEIYPRWLTGRVRKSSRIARALHLASRFPGLPSALEDAAAASEDAFDAAVSALRMAAAAPAFAELAAARDATEALEGRIWSPLEDPLLSGFPPASAPAPSPARPPG